MKMELSKALDYILGGNAAFTIENTKNGNRFTYKVQKLKSSANISLFFVSVLTGSDNDSNYAYLGAIRDGIFTIGYKSKITNRAISFIAFEKVFNDLKLGVYNVNLAFYHKGCCGKCGRTLTVPSSIVSGFGPECAKRNKKNEKRTSVTR